MPSHLQDEIADALERIIAGPEKKGAVMSEKKKRLVAYHEAGHALVSDLAGKADGASAAVLCTAHRRVLCSPAQSVHCMVPTVRRRAL